ncbi:class IV adenylate cyclase [Halobacteria archaeon AArc-dxtr1]|nr:class IV adenylate cyclase [Halobacteria archaeon AArc-dxtr1]
MYEVEVKVPAELGVVRDRLAEIGASPTDAVVQRDTYYDAPHRSFEETDEALRIRREEPADAEGGSSARVTYKGPLVDADSKTREEAETALGNGETFDAILGHLGFEPAATVRKERERYRIEGYTVTLDAVDGVGEYVEVETEAEDREIEAAREGAFELVERLSLDPDDQVRTSYLGMLLSN